MPMGCVTVIMFFDAHAIVSYYFKQETIVCLPIEEKHKVIKALKNIFHSLYFFSQTNHEIQFCFVNKKEGSSAMDEDGMKQNKAKKSKNKKKYSKIYYMNWIFRRDRASLMIESSYSTIGYTKNTLLKHGQKFVRSKKSSSVWQRENYRKIKPHQSVSQRLSRITQKKFPSQFHRWFIERMSDTRASNDYSIISFRARERENQQADY